MLQHRTYLCFGSVGAVSGSDNPGNNPRGRGVWMVFEEAIVNNRRWRTQGVDVKHFCRGRHNKRPGTPGDGASTRSKEPGLEPRKETAILCGELGTATSHAPREECSSQTLVSPYVIITLTGTGRVSTTIQLIINDMDKSKLPFNTGIAVCIFTSEGCHIKEGCVHESF